MSESQGINKKNIHYQIDLAHSHLPNLRKSYQVNIKPKTALFCFYPCFFSEFIPRSLTLSSWGIFLCGTLPYHTLPFIITTDDPDLKWFHLRFFDITTL